MRLVDPGVAYTAAMLFASDRERMVRVAGRKTDHAWPWLLAMAALGFASSIFGIRNPELLASIWNLM